MRSARELGPGDYAWSRVKGEPELRELRVNADLVATLRWKVGFAAEGAEAHTADGSWEFDRRGMLGKQAVIETRGGVPAAYVSEGWEGGGELQTGSGGRYRFRPTSVLSTRWAFVLPDDTMLVEYILERRRLFRTVEIVRVHQPATGGDDLPLLIMLGTWLAALGRRDQASAASFG